MTEEADIDVLKVRSGYIQLACYLSTGRGSILVVFIYGRDFFLFYNYQLERRWFESSFGVCI